MNQHQSHEVFKHERFREEAEKKLEEKMKGAGISIAALKKEKLAHELLICQLELELQGKALNEALESAKNAAGGSATLEHEPMGCVLVSRELKIITLNRSASELLGAGAGDEIMPLVAEDDIPEFMEFAAKVFRAGEKAACEISLASGGNTAKRVLISGVAGRGKGSCHMNLADITGARRADAARIESLERSARGLKAYAGEAAQGLKGPLMAARESIRSIKRGEAVMENAVYAEKVIERMMRITGEMLVCAADPSAAFGNAGAFEETDLNELVDEIFFRYSLNASGPGRQAELTRDELPRLRVAGSHMYLLFQNLVHNGMKFAAPDVTPKVHVGCVDRGDRYLFSVSDNGIGMKKRDIERIFSMPAGVLPGSDRSWGKNGLSVCRGIGELYKGRLWIESAAGKGTTFFFTIPKENAGIIIN